MTVALTKRSQTAAGANFLPSHLMTLTTIGMGPMISLQMNKIRSFSFPLTATCQANITFQYKIQCVD